ncbi:biotin carboxylase; acetyl-CoA carboxylase carboxyltransferase subunit alpha [Isosphaera pallida ATCC 43644]|uniref:Biotin carboxylase n=1 Tax=Isosphaera pallida (strain ATCC 43644 / DSM 9630 / IS1B) TaxID=575540 RepID=E8R4Z0_ISOPI|nr:acetyl-CoA carboxylase biotin carboxylase subunit [Isosphaera pallida]ADV62747.1 biotin carboxylase; acetyl-CoA carboxylase carboxyltransferase subunit alpha [Isosphaera pallida ATCC 43644]
MFQRILIANRGEIALRVIRACRDLGIEAVAVYSQADRDAPYVQLADRALCIGPASGLESYLNIPRIIAAAELADVQAIHPGYGFLSENPDFAEICRASNFEFIGPPHEAIRKMGLKTEAKAVAKAAKVDCVPGSDGPVDSDEEAVHLARQIRYPVLIKAAAGGGGKGMRVCQDESQLLANLKAARAEAEAAFKNPSVYLEKFIDRPRHVEVQILADNHGNCVHLFERECSVQRRHQKLIEEAPAASLPARARDRMCDAAVRLAKAAGYVNAGTIEFLVDQEFNTYFIEVNARIQVEHPVTELVTGIDLVKQQILVAAGQPLPFKQKDIAIRGHAFQCRINAEDSDHGFRPSPGRITHLRVPGGYGVRWDSQIVSGYVVPPHYDSLVAKLLVHGMDRDQAAAIMRRALDELEVEGIATTTPLHRRIFRNPDFLAGRVDTTWVERVLLASKGE